MSSSIGKELIGEKAFYTMVGGPDAIIPATDVDSVHVRLLAIQVRDACEVRPFLFDYQSVKLVLEVDSYTGVKRIGPYPQSCVITSDAGPANIFFEKVGLPQESLQYLRHAVTTTFAPLESQGFMGRLAAKAGREEVAAKTLVPILQAQKIVIFSRKK